MKTFIVLTALLAIAVAAPHDGRITNGQVAQPGQFPYQAALFIKDNVGRTFFCGGSVIKSDIIITAAHCLDGMKSAEVILGALNIMINEPGQVRQTVDEEKFTIHKEWNPNTFSNDIGLIKLNTPVEFNVHIQPIKLPNSDDHRTFVNKPATASGFGKVSDISTEISPELRFVEKSVMSILRCILFYPFVLISNNICMDTSGGESTCNGDSGGPLIFKDGTIDILIGITSFGSSSGCEKGKPAGFTRVTEQIEWIANNAQ